MSPEQSQRLENWLFEDKLTFEAAHQRARRELGFSGSATSLKRFFHRRLRERAESRERTESGFAETNRSAVDVLTAPGDVRRLRSGIMKVICQQVFRRVCDEPEAIKEWEPLVRLLLASERNELYRQAKGEDKVIREGYLNLAMKNKQLASLDQIMKNLPALNEHARQMQPFEGKYEERRRLNEALRMLFGEHAHTLPESEAEELEIEEGESIQEDAEEKAREHQRKTGEWIDAKVFEREDRRRKQVRYALPKLEHKNGFEI